MNNPDLNPHFNRGGLMHCPITPNEIAYMEEMAKKKRPFSFKKEIPDANGLPIKLYIYSRDFTGNSDAYKDFLKIWGDSYIVSVHLQRSGGDYYGVSRGVKLQEFLPTDKFVERLWETMENMYEFPKDNIHENENQINWF